MTDTNPLYIFLHKNNIKKMEITFPSFVYLKDIAMAYINIMKIASEKDSLQR